MVRGRGFGSGGPTGHMTYVLYCLYSTWVGRGGGGFGRWARPRGENGGSTNSQLVLRLRRRGPAASS